MAKKVYTPEQQIDRLRIYNVVAGSAHLLQAIGFAIVLTMLSSQVLFAVTADYLAGPPGVPLPPERVVLFEVNIGIGVVAFLALSAFFHFLISSPWFFARYKNGLLHNRNYFRWTEYSLSSSIMIWLILAINGVTDIGALFAIFAVNAAMILFGALQEKYEQPGSGGLLPFIFGSMVGIVPWILVLIYFLRPGSASDVAAPDFVVGIVISLFIFFNTFAINQWLQYKQVGKWKSYLQGERSYITLSLVAKTALAWQVFSGAIIPAIAS
ncbi:MAG: heliorhodopsin HeR [Actinomycetota bacterium]